jgi:hypothetical protein
MTVPDMKREVKVLGNTKVEKHRARKIGILKMHMYNVYIYIHTHMLYTLEVGPLSHNTT